MDDNQLKYNDDIMKLAMMGGARSVEHVGRLDINVECGQYMHADVCHDEYKIYCHWDDISAVMSLVMSYVVSNYYDEQSMVVHDDMVKLVLRKAA